MEKGDSTVTLKIPSSILDQLDTIAKLKSLKREDVIIDACVYYCQFYDMRGEEFPATMKSVFFNLAQHDDEFRTLLRKVVNDNADASSK